MRSLSIALIACATALTVASSCVLDRSGGLDPISEGTGASGAGGGGDTGGAAPDCTDATMCGGTTDCTTAVDCVDGSCAYTYAPAGTPCVGTTESAKVCDGIGNCVQCVVPSDCPTACADGVQVGNPQCVAGVCQSTGDEVQCGDYTCDAAGAECLTECTQKADCSDPMHECDVDPNGGGTCGPKRPDGDPCFVDVICDSGFCADGACCESECATQCQACSMTLTGFADGTCENILHAVDDPDMSCSLGFGCQGDGTCTACGEPAVPIMAGNCPAQCDNGCSGDQCNIVCDTAGECTGTITCPAGVDCDIQCTTDNACSGATFDCPPGRQCKLTCENNAGSCANATLNCGDGRCEMNCKNGSNGNCTNATVNCGANECDVKCSATGDPGYVDNVPSCNLKTDNEC